MAPRKQKAPAQALPRFIPPMLAKPGTAFDSDEHLFEVKWDGTRTLAFIEHGGYRLLNRRQIAMTARYSEFAGLAKFPDGSVLDGETIVFRDGKPDFGLLQSREQARSPLKVKSLARTMPASYRRKDRCEADPSWRQGLAITPVPGSAPGLVSGCG
jgi:ATP-dependent DNA ligase